MFGPHAFEDATHALLQFDNTKPAVPYVVKPSDGNGEYDLYPMDRGDDPTLRITISFDHYMYGGWVGYEHSTTHETDMRNVNIVWVGVPWSNSINDVKYWVTGALRVVQTTDDLKSFFTAVYGTWRLVRDLELGPELKNQSPSVVADALAKKYERIDDTDVDLIALVAGTRLFVAEYTLHGAMSLYRHVTEYAEQLHEQNYSFWKDVHDVKTKFLNPILDEFKNKHVRVGHG